MSKIQYILSNSLLGCLVVISDDWYFDLPYVNAINADKNAKMLANATMEFLIRVKLVRISSESDSSGIIDKCDICAVANPMLHTIQNPE